MSRMSSKIQLVKCQVFNHIFNNYTSKPLVIQEYKDINKEEDYSNQVYEPNLEEFSDLDEEDVQEKWFNTLSPNESEIEVKKEYGVSVLVIEEVLGDFLVKSPEAVNVVLKYFIDICSPELPSTLSPMLENHNVIDFKWHVELLNLLPHTCDEEDKDNPNLLSCSKPYLLILWIVFISFHILNYIVFIAINLKSVYVFFYLSWY